MARMLGSSKTVPWKLCSCRFCRTQERGFFSMHRYWKRSARQREDRLWKQEAR